MEDIKQKQVAGLLAALAAKVNTEPGKELSTNDYTDAEKSKLAGIDLAANSAADRNRANHTGTQAISTVDGLQTTLDAKAATAHTHLSTSILDFQEAVQDAVAAFMQSGGGVTLSYDDANNTYTISSSPGETFDPEKTRDAIGAALVPLGLIDIAINDAGDTISISTRATQNAPDAQLRDRATHTGTQAIETVEGLTSALANKTNNATTAALSGRVAELEAQVAELLARPQLTRDTLLALLEAGTNITIEPTAGGKVRINAAGGSTPTPQPETLAITDVFAS